MVGTWRPLSVLALWALIAVNAAHGQEYRAGDVRVIQPWARASAGPARAGAAYMRLETVGAGDKLISASTPMASRATPHRQFIENEIAKMRPVDAIEVEAGEATVLRPGGLHIMLMGLNEPLREGARFPLTLTFENAGTIEVEVVVRGVAARGSKTE